VKTGIQKDVGAIHELPLLTRMGIKMLNKKRPKYLLFIFFIIGILIFPVLSFADADKIFKENSKAVVVVVTYNEKGEPISQGSGFIVRSDGAVVTNYHVISNAKDIKVKVGDKILDVEGLIYTDKENDLVILKVKGEKLPVVKLGDIAKANVGEKVYVISSPEGLENTISDGLLSGIRDIASDKKVLQITAPVSSGSSGSPVFNKDGEVIGIATFLLEEAQNLNFAMPVNLITDKIRNKKVVLLKESDIEDYKKTAEYWFYRGVASGLDKEKIEAYKQSIRINPDIAAPHFNLGVVYNRLGMYKEAIESYRQGIRIEPDFVAAHVGLGFSYEQLGMSQEAIESYKQAIRINSDYAEAHFGLGLEYYVLDDRGSALEEYKILKELDKEKANQLFNLIYK
jgi:Tfp pilus assembly protein PilF